jgi:glutathione S-transferase
LPCSGLTLLFFACPLCVIIRDAHALGVALAVALGHGRVPIGAGARKDRHFGLESPYFAPAAKRYAKLFDDFEIALDQGPWLTGEHFSLAEVGYAPYLARLRHLGFDVLFERHPHVADWANRVAQRPSVKSGVEGWFNPKYLALFEEQRSSAKLAIARLLS